MPGWNELLNGLSISSDDPGIICSESFDIQETDSSFDANKVYGN